MNIPKKLDTAYISEDAFFIHERALGVSDGVGSWSKYGIKTHLFSNDLMNNSKSYIEELIQ